eukprot:10342552-Karenia_brevis.AAC.1
MAEAAFSSAKFCVSALRYPLRPPLTPVPARGSNWRKVGSNSMLSLGQGKKPSNVCGMSSLRCGCFAAS